MERCPNAYRPPIQEFPDDGRTWRIEGLGAVTRTEHEPTIQVHLTPDSLFKLTSKPYPTPERKQAWIGIGQLPYLKTGSHWRNKLLQSAEAGNRRVLRGITVTEDKTQLVRFGHSFGRIEGKKTGQNWLIPPFRYPFPRELSDSYCIAIEHDGDPYGILLPVAEAIRFYYAASTDLAHVMFNGALQLHQGHVIDPEFSGPADATSKRMVVALRRWLADADAWIIGRILGDTHAAAGAARIYESLLKAGANSQQAFPVCGLPFEGDADWTGRVIDVSPPGRDPEHRRWLILNLERCTGPFPYEELEVIRDNDNRKGDPLTDLPDEEKGPAWTHPTRRTEDQTGKLQSAEPPRADVQAAVFMEPDARFTAIEGKKIIKTAKEQCHYKSGQLFVPEAVASALLGTGQGTYAGSEVNPAEVEWTPEAEEKESRTRAKALPASFEGLEQVVAALNQTSGVHAEFRFSKSLAVLPKEYPDRKGDWAWLDAKRHLRRRIMIVDVVAFDRHVCIVECELREKESCATGILISRYDAPISDNELHYALRSHATARGVWKNTDGGPSVLVESLKHTQSTYAVRAEVILGRIRAVGGKL